MLELHHVGNLVEDIDSALVSYKLMFGDGCASGKIFVSSQNVYVCFVNVGKNVFIELIQPADETSLVYKMRKKGISYYHVAYTTNDIDAAHDYLVSINFKFFNSFNSEAFGNKRCQFLYSPEGSLIELIEN